MKVQTLSIGPTRLAAALLVLAGVQYVALEAVTAAAWNHPPYDYAVNFISDLGNPIAGDTFAGRVVDSPLHTVMNTAFVLQGVLVLSAALPHGWPRRSPPPAGWPAPPSATWAPMTVQRP